jgi:hypothetical protein
VRRGTRIFIGVVLTNAAARNFARTCPVALHRRVSMHRPFARAIDFRRSRWRTAVANIRQTQSVTEKGSAMAQQQGYGQQNRQSTQQGGEGRNEQRSDVQQRQNSGFQSRQFGGTQGQQGGARTRGRQQAQEGTATQGYGAQQMQSMAEVALRGTALLWDLQMETARNILRTQARTAALLGAPDCSELFRLGDDRARRIFAASAEQVLNSARQARETVFAVQRQIGRLAEQQTIGIAEEVREQIEQISRHTEEGLQEIEQITTSEADRAEDLVDYALRGEHEQNRSHFAEPAGQEHPSMQHAAGRNGQGAANEAANAAGETEANAENGMSDAAQRETRERGRARR